MNHFQFPVRFGTILISWNSDGQLNRIEWSENRLAVAKRIQLPAELAMLVDKIRSYFFDGEPIGFIPWNQIDQSAWSAFQKNVYLAVTDIPYGETRTYGWVAARLGGNGKASRAVGQALRRNPLPIVIPCHRITNANSRVLSEARLKCRLMHLEEEYRSPQFSFLKVGSARSEWDQVVSL